MDTNRILVIIFLFDNLILYLSSFLPIFLIVFSIMIFFFGGFRLQNVTPVTYSELRIERKNKFSEEEDVVLEDGSRPEIYSEEHEKVLGSTEKSWTLFVDGYGNDGKRIYDPVKGKTCHQCRFIEMKFFSNFHWKTIVCVILLSICALFSDFVQQCYQEQLR